MYRITVLAASGESFLPLPQKLCHANCLIMFWQLEPVVESGDGVNSFSCFD